MIQLPNQKNEPQKNKRMQIVSKTYDWTATNIITLAQAKANLRVDHVLDDVEIQAMIYAAYQTVEQTLNRLLIKQSITYQIEDSTASFSMKLAEPQTFKTFGDVTAIDTEGNTQTPSAKTIRLDGAWIEVSAITFATDVDVNSYRITVNYEPQLLDYSINAAVYLTLTHFYENRNAVVVGAAPHALPLGVERILSPYRYVPV